MSRSAGQGGSAGPGPAPEPFRRALESLRAGAARARQLRPEVVIEEAPAPQRLASFTAALEADVVQRDEELATGRLVLLHEPDGHESWQGVFRLVTFVRAALEPEIAADPLLGGVGWDWLLEALAARGARHVAASGTVTRVASESFGAMAMRPKDAEVEIRASWTPVGTDLDPHLQGWCELLCMTAGLPPLPAGVSAVAGRRAARSR